MNIAIMGLGLIGGSWALALREWAKTEEGRAANLTVIGFDIKGKQRLLADEMKICDIYAKSPMEAVKDAQIVIVATPATAVRDTFEDIADHLRPGTIVTDTCSTKRQVMRWAKELLPTTVHFVGGHPMAGKTASLEAAEASLFKDATYCVIAGTNVNEQALETTVHLIEAIGARPYFVEAAEHDSYVAAISHIPYLAAVGLTNLAGDSEAWREMTRLASTGFQDTTRLASGNMTVYVDICRTNSDMIIGWLDRYQEQLTQLRASIVEAGFYDERGKPREASEARGLETIVGRALLTREKWLFNRNKPDVTERNSAAPMPAKEDIKPDYSRMFFGGIFNRRKPPTDKK